MTHARDEVLQTCDNVLQAYELTYVTEHANVFASLSLQLEDLYKGTYCIVISSCRIDLVIIIVMSSLFLYIVFVVKSILSVYLYGYFKLIS